MNNRILRSVLSDEWVACTQSGNKTNTLTFTATKDLDGYYFLCEITDPYGNSGDTRQRC